MTARDPLLEHVRDVVHEACPDVEKTFETMTRRPSLPTSPELAAVLEPKKNAAAKRTFDAFAPSHRREYVEGISEAKQPETCARLAQTSVQLAEDKTLHWKYASR